MMQLDATERLRKYGDGGFECVRGWLGRQMLPALEACQLAQVELGVGGSIAEIGVHHGLFFLALDQLRAKGERAVAIDIFDSQELNIDFSGNGSERVFRENLSKYGVDERSVATCAVDSLDIDHAFVLDKVRGQKVKLFSIDAGHTVEHTVHDLRIAEGCVANGGIIFLDDFANENWPGVTEGLMRYMLFQSPKIVPFAVCAKKLMLTTLSYHARMLALLKKHLQADDGLRLKKVKMFSHEVITVRVAKEKVKGARQA